MSNTDSFSKLRPMELIPFMHEGQVMIALRDPLKISPPLMVPQQTAEIIELLNGRNSTVDIQAHFMRKYNQLVYSHEIEGLAAALDEYFMLDNDNFLNRLQSLVVEFKNSPIRVCAMAGTSYPKEPAELERFLLQVLGLDERPASPRTAQAGTRALAGLAAPHIDYERGRNCYAVSYHALLAAKRPRTIIILGIDHTGSPAPVIMSRKDYETPFGTVKTDQDCIERLLVDYPGDPFRYEFAQKNEHSIEFQAVMLKFLYGDDAPNIVPILASQVENPSTQAKQQQFCRNLANLLATSSGDLCLLAAVDLSHVGTQFGGNALPESGLPELEKFDRQLLDTVCSADDRTLSELMRGAGQKFNVCGYPALMFMATALNGYEGTILDYGQWHDAASGSSVTFASLIFPHR